MSNHFYKTFLPVVCFLLVTIFACTDQTKPPTSTETTGPQFASTAIKKSFTEVMAIHDEVMPFISEMKRERKQLQALKETTEKSPEEIQAIDQAIQHLAQGDSLMFDWMQSFRTPDIETPESQALPYLAKEKDKISLVNREMKAAMTKAKNILGNQ